MKRFTREGPEEQERQLIPAQSAAEEEEALLVPSFEGGVAGARRLSRRQALGLLGGSLVGAGLLSSGLAAPAEATLPPGALPPGNLWWMWGPTGQPGQPIQMGVAPSGNWYELTVKRMCVFAQQVVNDTFRTNWTLMEDDDTSADDVIYATVAPNVHSATSGWTTFVPSRVSPSNPQQVLVTGTRSWHQDDLDTELGGEELYAIVRLQNVTQNSLILQRQSARLPLSP